MYYIKEEKVNEIKKNFKGIDIAKKVGISPTYVSLVINGLKTCPKRTAFCLAKAFNNDAEIQDYFERIS